MNFYCAKPKTKRRKGLSLPPLAVSLFCLLLCLGGGDRPLYHTLLFLAGCRDFPFQTWYFLIFPVAVGCCVVCFYIPVMQGIE